MTNTYVAYMLAPSRRGSAQLALSNTTIATSEQQIKEFIPTKDNANLAATFIEIDNHRRNRNNWPELDKAIDYCQKTKAHLLIVQLHNLTNNEFFTSKILALLENQSINLHCCVENYINRDNFKSLAEHNKRQKKMHGDLIRQGLKNSNAKSGNPNALSVINKVNKPKIDNAIIFALILQPVIMEYRKLNYSQRKMVTALNEERFCAPEGGKWVLSQLQKVLDRLRVNDAAFDLEDTFVEFTAKNMRPQEMAIALNEANILSPKGCAWNEQTVTMVRQRIAQLKDINDFNKFTLELLPILKKYPLNELDEHILLQELQKLHIGLPIKEKNPAI